MTDEHEEPWWLRCLPDRTPRADLGCKKLSVLKGVLWMRGVIVNWAMQKRVAAAAGKMVKIYCEKAEYLR